MRNPLAVRLYGTALLLGVVAVVLTTCPACGTTTTYNITFQSGAFRVADKLEVTPGQGGDDASTLAGAATTGGIESSPGGSNIIRGFADQANIFQIGTSSKPDTSATVDAQASATVQSPNSTTGSEGETTGAPAEVPTP